MFDIGFTELVLLGIIGLIVIGPQKLPHTIRMIVAWTGRIKRTVNDLKVELEHEVDAQEIRQRIENEIEKTGIKELASELQEHSAEIQKNIQLPAEQFAESAKTLNPLPTDKNN